MRAPFADWRPLVGPRRDLLLLSPLAAAGGRSRARGRREMRKSRRKEWNVGGGKSRWLSFRFPLSLRSPLFVRRLSFHGCPAPRSLLVSRGAPVAGLFGALRSARCLAAANYFYGDQTAQSMPNDGLLASPEKCPFGFSFTRRTSDGGSAARRA